MSDLGFGCYRVWSGNRQHHEALATALQLGCTLIDTASNYTNGASELLVGDVLVELPHLPAFVITKVGYVTKDMVQRWSAEGLPGTGLHRISDESHYSLEPEFIHYQVEISRQRLRLPIIDAVLLHNPEHLPGPSEAVDATIYEAFMALEDCVTKGAIRYYGVSSGALTRSTSDSTPSLYERVISAAVRIGAGNHFLVVEFPFNFVERDAATSVAGSQSLIDAIRTSGRISVTNRPLSGLLDGRALRFAEPHPGAFDHGGSPALDRCVGLVRERLAEAELDHDVFDFTVMQFLRDNWYGVESPDLVDVIFDRHVLPFLLHLFSGEVPDQVRVAFESLHEVATLSSTLHLSEAGRRAYRDLVDRGAISSTSSESLAVAACRFAMEAGANHVVVGMRKEAYVRDLSSLLAAGRRTQIEA